ncbi:hypothetical protein OGH69_01650 [Flavobacterium sp. MFBS3-15]|uniref:hypothetical protein n=1 Tax=Flavobacterium sp. MFBS3-15 TaxID=2989816 RepID=UPI0022357C89|nr:hypothetical protein [Flavobacterium sp. MFBS3-15]MCW4467660.1 hypothetical protein [Flavobacterium sp. MFBS3-15]
MKKYSLDPDGISAFHDMIGALGDEGLVRHAQAASTDFLSWAAGNFELDVSLLEELRALPGRFLLQAGWWAGACLVGRMPLHFLFSCLVRRAF